MSRKRLDPPELKDEPAKVAYRACRSKHRYANEYEAEKAARRYSARGTPLRWYFCHRCGGGYHLSKRFGAEDQ